VKAISIRQPWAWLITLGYKDIENRSWPTAYRGPVLIHAGLRKADPDVVSDVLGRLDRAERLKLSQRMPALDDLPAGGIVGIAEIVDCVAHSNSRWFEGPYGFILRNPHPIPFVRYPGTLRLFDIPTELILDLAAILKQQGG
jgi:hypothetical protein